jgi:2,4'-dihydroxyacetophenone dioxygenase
MSSSSSTPSLPFGINDLVTQAVPDDERLWVPQAENVWFRPLLLDRVAGLWVNLLRVRKSGVLSRHRHPAPVHGFVIKGAWRYLEHDWIAEAGSYVFEPPGDVHTLVNCDGYDEMITLFHISGALIYIDEDGETCGFDDVHTKIEMCRNHFDAVGLGADYVAKFVR